MSLPQLILIENIISKYFLGFIVAPSICLRHHLVPLGLILTLSSLLYLSNLEGYGRRLHKIACFLLNV